MITESILTCPHCDHNKSEELYENISPNNFRCEGCQQKVKATINDCCIYCQYGDYPCIQSQIVGSSCCGGE